MKNKTIRFRVTEDEYTKIVELSGGNMSSWILSRLDLKAVNGEKPRTRIVDSLMINKPEHTLGASDVRYPIADMQIPKEPSRWCQAAQCKKIAIGSSTIEGCLVWLCKDHLSGIP